MTTEELRTFMRERHDRYWELLATAVGEAESLSATVNGLSAKVIGEAERGAATSPTMVWARVCALAAWSPNELFRLSQTWPRPDEVSSDIMDIGADFWMSAWLPTLNYFGPELAKRYPVVCSMPLPLRAKLSELQSPRRLVSTWEALNSAIEQAAGVLAEYARIDFAPDASVTLERLLELLRCGAVPSLDPLRPLVRAPLVVDRSATRYIEMLLEERWLRTDEPPEMLREVGIVMQLALQFQVSEDLLSRSMEFLQSRIIADGPRGWASFAYLLAGTHWRSP